MVRGPKKIENHWSHVISAGFRWWGSRHIGGPMCEL